jgi:hypothetical protein
LNIQHLHEEIHHHTSIEAAASDEIPHKRRVAATISSGICIAIEAVCPP